MTREKVSSVVNVPEQQFKEVWVKTLGTCLNTAQTSEA
jgi:hypothetical protein